MNETVKAYGERTLGEVNSPGKLQEWIEALPIAQMSWGQVSAAEAAQCTTFIGGNTGLAIDKDAVWEGEIRWAAGIIYVRASEASKIIWRVKPDFVPYRLRDLAIPEEFSARLAERGHDFGVNCYFRAAFIEEK